MMPTWIHSVCTPSIPSLPVCTAPTRGQSKRHPQTGPANPSHIRMAPTSAHPGVPGQYHFDTSHSTREGPAHCPTGSSPDHLCTGHPASTAQGDPQPMPWEPWHWDTPISCFTYLQPIKATWHTQSIQGAFLHKAIPSRLGEVALSTKS